MQPTAQLALRDCSPETELRQRHVPRRTGLTGHGSLPAVQPAGEEEGRDEAGVEERGGVERGRTTRFEG